MMTRFIYPGSIVHLALCGLLVVCTLVYGARLAVKGRPLLPRQLPVFVLGGLPLVLYAYVFRPHDGFSLLGATENWLSHLLIDVIAIAYFACLWRAVRGGHRGEKGKKRPIGAPGGRDE